MNVNTQLSHFTGTENYYRYLLGLLITDGVKQAATEFECFWFLDVIASYQYKLKHQEFQTWLLTKHPDSSATVECTDGNDNIIVKQNIPFTDFKATTFTIWLENEVMLLPSEH